MPVTIEDIEEDIANLEQHIYAAEIMRERLDGQIRSLRQQEQTPQVQAEIAELRAYRDRCTNQIRNAQRDINRCNQRIRSLRR